MNMMTVADASDFIRGITFKPHELIDPSDPDAIVCMRTKNIQADLDQRDLIAVPTRLVRQEQKLLREGDILISSANSWELVGKCSYVPELPYRATAGGFIAIVRPKSRTHPRFLYHWLNSPATQHVIRNMGRQTTNISNLDVNRFKEIELPAFGFDEQCRIAAILDKADAIRRKREHALTLADDFLRSVFLEMFGDPSTNSKGWPVGTIRDLIVDAKYGTSQKADVDEGSYPVLRMGNLTYSGRIDTTDLKYLDLNQKDVEKYTVRRGDILFNRTNSRELVGKTAVVMVDEVYAYAGYLVRARTNRKANPHYISAFLNSTFGKAILHGMCKSIVGMANINAQEFQNIRIPVPPVDLQNRFGAILERTEATRQLLLSDRRHAADLFSALSQRAFAGDL